MLNSSLVLQKEASKLPFFIECYNLIKRVLMKYLIRLLMAALSLSLMACAQTQVDRVDPITNSSPTYPEEGTESRAYRLDEILLPNQPQTLTQEKNGVLFDYSNMKDGYVSIYSPELSVNQKVQVLVEDATYTYDLIPLEYVVVPLQHGSNTYTLRSLKNTSDNAYTITNSIVLDVVMENEVSAFLYPNQIINYTQDTDAIRKSFELTQNAKSDLRRVFEIYTFITSTIDYDYEKAEKAKTTFLLPVIDETLESQKGICFDYAALMSAMLRAQHIPTRLITGMTDLGYHAWVEVYLSDLGWINPELYFSYQDWTFVDPTFDALGVYEGAYQSKDRY